MGRARRFYYFLGVPILRGVIRLLTMTYRIEKVIGANHIEPYIDGETICAPCYWHQHHIVGSTLIRSWVRRGFKALGNLFALGHIGKQKGLAVLGPLQLKPFEVAVLPIGVREVHHPGLPIGDGAFVHPTLNL